MPRSVQLLLLCLQSLLLQACAGRDTPDAAGRAPRLTSISAGNMFTCGLDTDRVLWCWGVNSYGQLGVGDFEDRHRPVRVLLNTPVTQVVAGDGRVCVIDVAAAVHCWGDNVAGALADSTIERRAIPAVMPFGPARHVAVGSRFTCATDMAGRAHCWGGDLHGELGDGGDTIRSRVAAAPVAAPVAFDTLVAGRLHACGLAADGAAWCWGGEGLAGDGSRATHRAPVAVSGGHRFRSLTAAYGVTCGIDDKEAAWCWGLDSDGQLGRGESAQNTFTPVAVAGGQRYRQLAAGYHRVCGLDTVGTAWCWGSNFRGALGDTGRLSSLRPVPVHGNRRYTSVASGESHTCALDAAGQAWCWGQNRLGEGGGALGDGTLDDRTFPARILSPMTQGSIDSVIAPPPKRR